MDVKQPSFTTMQTIETRTDNSRRLTMHAIDLLEKRYGTRKTWRRPVENFLLTINTNMRSSDCFANCTLDARSYGWKSPIVTAIHHGINHLFYGKKL